MSLCPEPLKTHRVGEQGEQCTLNLSRTQTLPPIGMVGKLGERVPTQVSSSLLNRGSKLRGPSPKALV
ncbi:hypothetical protein TNCV_809101 [Trichonephila clavipes]|nr:hypothetical protein TNCV_809101 [Trichonephila clavipes]